MLAAFLDVKGAFDGVIIDILLQKLASIGCPKNLVSFIKFLTSERFIHTNTTGDLPRMVYKGVPQGGVLSPLLYVLYVSHIMNNIPKTLNVSQFADDIAIFCKFSSRKRATSIISNSIKKIDKNLRELGLELAPSKTQLIHFNNKNIAPGKIEIDINEYKIKLSPSARFLGITFDYRHSFSTHINQMLKKCLKALNILKFLCGIS